MHQRHTTARFAAIGFALVLLLAACGSSSGSDASSAEKGTTTTTSSTSTTGGDSSGGSALKITIKGFKFMPKELDAKVGDTITIVNEDSADHTATSTDGPAKFDTGRIKSGESKKIRLTKAGTYDYKCSIHDYMKGTIKVS